MTKQDYTHITMVVDRSGSMSQIRMDAQGGVNTFITEQKAQPGECSFQLVEFDTVHDNVFGPGPLADAPSYHLHPRGGTAMLDAIGFAIVKTGQYLKDKPEAERPANVVFVIVTDGEENSSIEYTTEMIKDMVDRQTNEYGWVFDFLSAGKDAVLTARSMGVSNSMAFVGASGQSMSSVYGNTSSNVSTLRSTGNYAGGNRSVDSEGNLSTSV